jgi:hypothetical protein
MRRVKTGACRVPPPAVRYRERQTFHRQVGAEAAET